MIFLPDSCAPGLLKIIRIFFVLFMMTVTPTVSLAADELNAFPVVMTLEEAASFLRSDQDKVVQMISDDCLPGRKVGGQWRFSRAALLDWLARKAPYTNCDKVAASTNESQGKGQAVSPPGIISENAFDILPTDIQMSPVREMSAVKGRGTEQSGTEAGGAKPETVGEKPDFQTAEDALLRGEQLLLKAGQLTLEPGLFYSRSEQQGLTVVTIGDNAYIGYTEGEQDRYFSNLTVRYGMKYDLQLSVSVPYIYQKDTATATIAGSTQTEEKMDRQNEFGDVIAGVRHTFIKEGPGRPDVILSLEGHIPTGDSSWGVEGGLSLVKRMDPAVLFADFSYRRIFSREFDDPSRLQPEHIVTGGLGYALSLNDRLAINSSVTGTYTSHTTFENPDLPDLPDSRRFNLNLGLTTQMSEKYYIDTSLGFSLNGPRSVTLGISLPYTFGL